MFVLGAFFRKCILPEGPATELSKVVNIPKCWVFIDCTVVLHIPRCKFDAKITPKMNLNKSPTCFECLGVGKYGLGPRGRKTWFRGREAGVGPWGGAVGSWAHGPHGHHGFHMGPWVQWALCPPWSPYTFFIAALKHHWKVMKFTRHILKVIGNRLKKTKESVENILKWAWTSYEHVVKNTLNLWISHEEQHRLSGKTIYESNENTQLRDVIFLFRWGYFRELC